MDKEKYDSGEYVCKIVNCGRASSWGDDCYSYSMKEVKEEIVRCRDCKHYTDDEMEYYHYCGFWCGQVEPNGYCSNGEKGDA